MHNRPPSADPTGPSDRDGAYSVRSVPVRVYLPDGPVLQDLVPPLLEDGLYLFLHYCLLDDADHMAGAANTLSHFLSTCIPLLFPCHSLAPTQSGICSNSQDIHKLAYALIQGVLSPLEAEMAWLGACLAGADGWLNICVGIIGN